MTDALSAAIESILRADDLSEEIHQAQINNLRDAYEATLAQPVQEPVLQALADADRIMGHDDESTEWRERWAHLFSCALTNGGYQCSCGANQRNAK